MPPALSGVADYSGWLVKRLGQLAELEINPQTPTGRVIYHIGNNPLHRDIYHTALARPGIVVIQDAVLHHFYLGLLDESSYLEEFVYNYGEWTRGLATNLWKNRSRSGADADYFDFPMLRRITENAECVVVHNKAAAEIVREHSPNARIEEIPHLYEPSGSLDRRRERIRRHGPRFGRARAGLRRASSRSLPRRRDGPGKPRTSPAAVHDLPDGRRRGRGVRTPLMTLRNNELTHLPNFAE